MSIISRTMKVTVYPGNTQAITVTGLYDTLSESFMNAATVTATLVDDNGDIVPGCDHAPLDYIPSSNGDYQGTFGDNTFQPSVGTGYTLMIDGQEGAGYIHMEIVAEVSVRQQ